MSYFVVIRERAPVWNRSLQISEQEKFAEHASFMNELTEEGFLVLGGPMEEGERILMIAKAESKEEAQKRIEADPWERAGVLKIVSIWRWEVMIGSLKE